MRDCTAGKVRLFIYRIFKHPSKYGDIDGGPVLVTDGWRRSCAWLAYTWAWKNSERWKKERVAKRKGLGAFKRWIILAHRPFSNLLMMRPVMRKEPGSIFSDEFILYGREKKKNSAAIKSAVHVLLIFCLPAPDSKSHLHLSEFSHQWRVNTYCLRQ